MVDLVITAANVLATGGASSVDGVAGVVITAGQVLYLEGATGKVKLADANSATAEVRKVYGIALNGAAVDQPVKVLRSGPVTIGAAVTAGVEYYLSPTAGGIAPVADLVSGCYPTSLGFATSATVLNVKPQESGVALA